MTEVILLLVGAALVLTASAATTLLLRPDSPTDAAVTFGVVAAAGVAATMLLAGAVGLLEPGYVLGLQGAWAAGAAMLAARSGRSWPRWPRLDVRVRVSTHPWEAALIALAAVALAWQTVVALVLPPFAFDALTYHLTIVASWVKQGSLEPTTLSICCAYYPATSELLFAWPVLILGDDSLVDLVQIPFVALGAAATAGIARSAGLPRAAAAAAGALFAVTPIVLAQAPTNYADVLVAACILAALHSIVRYAATREPSRLVVAGLATGLVLGTKGTGIVWGVALLALGAGVALAHTRSGRLPPRTAARALATFLALALALGSYWYARNWIDTSNPAYPFEISLGSTKVFDGPFRVDDVLTRPEAAADAPWLVPAVRSWAADLLPWREGTYDYQERLGGLGPLWPWLGLPLLLPLVLWLVRRRSAALLAPLAVGVVLAVQPYAWWSRFTIPLAAMGAVAIAATAVWAPRGWMRAGVRIAALGLALAGVALASYEVDPAARAPQLRSTDLVGLVGEPARERTAGRLFFGEYRFLERVPADATVAVDLRAEPVRFVYPLFGSDLERTVVAASASPRAGTWVVTAPDRAIDRALRGDGRFKLAFEERGLRAWMPVR